MSCCLLPVAFDRLYFHLVGKELPTPAALQCHASGFQCCCCYLCCRCRYCLFCYFCAAAVTAAAACAAGRFTREEEVRHCADRLVAEVRRLREMSPLYDAAMEAMSGKTDDSPKLVWT